MQDLDARLSAIAAKRWQLGLLLTALMLTGYFGFIFLVAFGKPLLATLLMPGLTVGILVGAMVILFAQGLTLFYVNWANNTYDPIINQIIAEREGAKK